MTDADSGVGLEGVQIGFYDAIGEFRWDLWATRTDSLGNFPIGGVPPGTYYLRADGGELGYVSEAYDGRPCPGSSMYSLACDPTQGALLAVATGTSLTADIDLERGSVSGTIRGQHTGLGIESVGVSILNAAGQSVSGSQTDATGAYLAPGLPTSL